MLSLRTSIHPAQVAVIQSCYRVSEEDYAEAGAILSGGEAVFGNRGAMCEIGTHRRWAQIVRQRGEIYGVVRQGSALGVVA